MGGLPQNGWQVNGIDLATRSSAKRQQMAQSDVDGNTSGGIGVEPLNRKIGG